jgi:hypothetical protein
VWPIDLVDDMGQHLVWQYDHRPSWNGLAINQRNDRSGANANSSCDTMVE